jgi:hypothetical protein
MRVENVAAEKNPGLISSEHLTWLGLGIVQAHKHVVGRKLAKGAAQASDQNASHLG